MTETALRTLGIASVAVLLATPPALLLAYAAAAKRRWWTLPVEAAVLLPLVMPPTVVGLAGVLLLARRGLGGAFDTSLLFRLEAAVLVAAAVALPLIYLPAKAAFAGIDRDLIDAGRTLGARRGALLRHVSLPLARRGIVAGLMLGLARALGEFGATMMVLGWQPGKETLSISIYAAFERGDLAAAAAPAGVLAAAAATITVGCRLLLRGD